MSMPRIAGALLILAVLGAWSWRAQPFPTMTELIESPRRYAGRTVYGFIDARTVQRTGDGFIIDQRGVRLHVLWEGGGEVPLHCLVDIKGRFEPPDRLRAEAVHFMKKRPLKIAVSIVPALLCLPFAFMSVRWDRARRAFALNRRRRRA